VGYQRFRRAQAKKTGVRAWRDIMIHGNAVSSVRGDRTTGARLFVLQQGRMSSVRVVIAARPARAAPAGTLPLDAGALRRIASSWPRCPRVRVSAMSIR